MSSPCTYIRTYVYACTITRSCIGVNKEFRLNMSTITACHVHVYARKLKGSDKACFSHNYIHFKPFSSAMYACSHTPKTVNKVKGSCWVVYMTQFSIHSWNMTQPIRFIHLG